MKPISKKWIIRILTSFCLVVMGLSVSFAQTDDRTLWEKHVVYEGESNIRTVSPGDYTGDGIPDLISSCDGKTRLFVGPDFKEYVIGDAPDHSFIYSVAYDVDGDGDLDFVGARHQKPGLVIWFEQPENPTGGLWTARPVSTELTGIHSLALADIDQDGRLDLLAPSALNQDNKPYPESLVWFSTPKNPQELDEWQPIVFADKDAPGSTHYIGVGDINNDGRVDAAVGAKEMEFPNGRYFAWWEAPKNPTEPWKKHLINKKHDGATHIYPHDVDKDGQMDFIISRGHEFGVSWLKGPNWEEQVIHADIVNPHALTLADMDNDGDTDVVSVAFGGMVAWWYENLGKGQFANHLVATNQAAYDVRTCDMDQDGDLDIVIAGQQSKNLVWYENSK